MISLGAVSTEDLVFPQSERTSYCLHSIKPVPPRREEMVWLTVLSIWLENKRLQNHIRNDSWSLGTN